LQRKISGQLFIETWLTVPTKNVNILSRPSGLF